MSKRKHSNKSNNSYHSVFKELDLLDNHNYNQTTSTSNNEDKETREEPFISSLDVLNNLLQTNVVSPEVVRYSVKSLRQQRATIKNNDKDIEKKIPHLDDKILVSSDPTKESPQEKQKESSSNTNIRTRPVALRFCYDGANFSGLAQNLGQEQDQSVEKAIFKALLKAKLIPSESRSECKYSRCGRTDRGVSAAGQVVALFLKSAIPIDASFTKEPQQQLDDKINNDQLPKNEYETIKVWILPKNKKKKATNNNHDDDDSKVVRVEKEVSEYPYTKILNNLLPPEIRMLGWAPVSEQFSARFSATTRTYRYFFVKRSLDLERMRQGLKLLVGKHDFRNFCKMDVEKVYNFERVIHCTELMQQNSPSTTSVDDDKDSICYVQIVGQAFLWHQIRCIMQVLFMIGKCQESTTIITELLNVSKYPGKPSYPLAPEKPLVLHDCGYSNLQVGYSVQNLWTVSCQLEQQWEELILAAARIRNCITSIVNKSVLRQDLVDFVTFKTTDKERKLQRSGLLSMSSTATKVQDLSIMLLQASTEKNQNDDSTETATEITTISWQDALTYLEKQGLVPDSSGLDTSVHIPLLQRSKGATYEEKIINLKKSERRREKFETNVIKKRKTAEEDAAFYRHMTKQGGTAM